MVKERSRIVLYPFCTSQHRFLHVKYQVLCGNWWSEDPKALIEDLENILHLSWYFWFPSPLSLGKAQIISHIVKIDYKIRNCIYITSILSFHYFISFWAIWLYHIYFIISLHYYFLRYLTISSIGGLSEVMIPKSLVPQICLSNIYIV